MNTIMSGFKTVIATGVFLTVGAVLVSPTLAACPGVADKSHTGHAGAAVSEDCDGAAMAPAMTEADLEAKWGIKIKGVHLSAANFMIDFRYQVTDPEKAAPILNRRFKPVLIDEATGVTMEVPSFEKIGALRQDTLAPVAGRTYFVLFANAGRFVEQGQKITVVIGDLKVEHIVVGG